MKIYPYLTIPYVVFDRVSTSILHLPIGRGAGTSAWGGRETGHSMADSSWKILPYRSRRVSNAVKHLLKFYKLSPIFSQFIFMPHVLNYMKITNCTYICKLVRNFWLYEWLWFALLFLRKYFYSKSGQLSADGRQKSAAEAGAGALQVKDLEPLRNLGKSLYRSMPFSHIG